MLIQQVSAEEALRSLRSGSGGLSPDEAKRRFVEFGPNRIAHLPGPSAAARLLAGFCHFLALILWLAAILAFVAEHMEPGSGMASLGFAIIGVIVINALFSFWQEHKAERALASLEKLLPTDVRVLREGMIRQVPAEHVVPGDLVSLGAGDDVPADCRLIHAVDVCVNLATVTGESLPQARNAEPGPPVDLLCARNIVLAGTAILSGQAQALVFATGMRTEFGKIARLSQASEAPPSPLQREIVRVSRLIAGWSLFLGVVFFFLGRALGLSFWSNFLFAIGVIVANVPEGLLPTVTLALAMGSQRMARRNALIRHLPAVESLGCTTVICSDKTGTLTENRMTVRRVCLPGRAIEELGKNELVEASKTFPEFFAIALRCHDLEETETRGVRTLLGDPLELALVHYAQEAIPEECAGERVDEVPFDSDRCRVSTIHRTPAGLVLYCKGALEVLLPRCTAERLAGELRPLSPDVSAGWLRRQDELAEEGYRVLALAYRSLEDGYDRNTVEQNLILAGLVAFEDPPRAEVPAAVRACREAGIRVIMVTGDHPRTAAAIARRIGLVEGAGTVITGDQVARLSDVQLQLVLDTPDLSFARVAADQKMRIVAALQAKGHIVAVTGDGVNDAPALRRADIGIAMGRSGTDVARAASAMVLADDNFASIVAAIEEGRAVYANIRKFLTYILTSNVPELVPYLAFVLFRIPLPLTVIQILAVDLGTDMLPALALGTEAPEPDVMRVPPRSRSERLLDLPVLLRSYFFLGPIESAAALAAFFFVLVSAGWTRGTSLPADSLLYRQATTACLTAIIVLQAVNVFLCRSRRRSLLEMKWFANPLLLAGVAFELAVILLIDYSAIGNALFGTAPLTWVVWLFLVPFAVGLALLEELRKHAVRALSGSSMATPWAPTADGIRPDSARNTQADMPCRSKSAAV